MVGKSTCGSGATGSSGKATTPIRKIPAMSSEVAIGRWMKPVEIFMWQRPWSLRSRVHLLRSTPRRSGVGSRRRADTAHRCARMQPVLIAEHDLLAILQPIGHDGQIVILVTNFQQPRFHRGVRLDDVGEHAVRAALNGV